VDYSEILGENYAEEFKAIPATEDWLFAAEKTGLKISGHPTIKRLLL